VPGTPEEASAEGDATRLTALDETDDDPFTPTPMSKSARREILNALALVGTEERPYPKGVVYGVAYLPG